MSQIPRNILINLASSTPGPNQTFPPFATQYVFTSDPPVNAFNAPCGSVILDVHDATTPTVTAVKGDTLWKGCEVIEEGDVWVMQGVKNVKPQLNEKQSLASLVDTFNHTQTYLRSVVDSRTT